MFRRISREARHTTHPIQEVARQMTSIFGDFSVRTHETTSLGQFLSCLQLDQWLLPRLLPIRHAKHSWLARPLSVAELNEFLPGRPNEIYRQNSISRQRFFNHLKCYHVEQTA